MELYKLNASKLSKMLKDKECSALELTKSVLDRIEEKESDIGAYISVDKEGALKKAQEVDEKRCKGETLHTLAGIPIGIKDNICIKGMPTTCASKMLYNFVPPYNATVIEKLDKTDCVYLGKLNMDEFAMGSSTENSAFKKTKNPHNLEYVPGGSSGGSAAAVAAGEAIITLGSDTGGSIRQPSAYCGVVGLKPTYGSVSRYGLVAFASSLDQIGPIARSVEDLALTYSAICGKDSMDTTTVSREYPDFAKELDFNIKGLKIGIPKEYEKLGATLVSVSLPTIDYALSAYYIISSAEASSNLARFDGVKYGYRSEKFKNLEELYLNTRNEGFGAEVKRRIMLGTYVLSSGYYDAYYKKAKFTQQLIQKQYADAFTQCDLLLTPTTPDTAFKIGENIDDQVKMYLNDILTVMINIAGLPAISMPCGFDSKNLPIGCQLIGSKFSEQTLFNVSGCYENLIGGSDLSKTL